MKFSAIFLLLSFVFADQVSAQVTPDHYTVYQSDNRVLIPLNGEWQKVIDDENKESIIVPFTSEEPSSYTLIRSVYIPDPKGKVLEFVSAGINHQVSLSINDQFVGSHQGGFFPFRIKIPREILNTNNSVKVTLQIDERLSYNQTIPVHLMPGDASSEYGFLGSVYLQLRPAVSVEFPQLNYTVNLPKNEVKFKPTISIQSAEYISTVANGIPDEWKTSGAPVTVKYSILDASSAVLLTDQKEVVIESDRSKTVEFKESVFSPKLWSPEHPESYTAHIEIFGNGILLDKVETPVAFRSVQVSGSEFLLNGNVVRLRGISFIQFAQSQKEMNNQDLYKILKLIQQTGANSVRFDAYPPSRDALNICDSLGLLAFAQIPVFNIPSALTFTKPIQVQSEVMLREMLNLHELHPSLIAVGLASALTANHDLEFILKQNELLKQINPSVLSYVITRNPQLRDELPTIDLLGLRLGHLKLDELQNMLTELKSDGRYFVASYGREIEPNNHNGYSDKQSQEYQAKYFTERFKEFKTLNVISGSFAASLLDYPVSSPRINSGNTDIYKVTTGIVNDDLTPRSAYTYLKNLYSNEITFNPPIGKYSSGIKVVFPIFGVILIFIFMFFFSSNRRFRDNMSRSFNRPFSFFTDIRDHRVILGLQTFGLVFLLAFTWALFFLSFGYGLRYSPTFDYLLSVLFPWSNIKEMIIGWTWSPISGIFILSMIFTVILGLFVLFIVVLGWLIKRKITMTQSLICVIWSAAPSLCIVIFAMVFEQVAISIPWLVPYIFGFVVYLIFWSLWRMMKGIRIITVAKSGRVYTVGILLIILTIAAVYFHYNYYYQAPDYVIHAFQAFK